MGVDEKKPRPTVALPTLCRIVEAICQEGAERHKFVEVHLLH